MNAGSLTVDCPHCGRALPPIHLDLSTVGGSGSLQVDVSPRFGGSFYQAARLAHPRCFGGKDDGPIQSPEDVRYLNALRAS